MAKNFVSHTNGTVTIDGSTGQNNKMERGGSVVSNPIWEPAAPNSPEQRFDDPKYANQTGGYGEVGVRQTAFNQHGPAGMVEPAKPQPDLSGRHPSRSSETMSSDSVGMFLALSWMTCGNDIKSCVVSASQLERVTARRYPPTSSI